MKQRCFRLMWIIAVTCCLLTPPFAYAESKSEKIRRLTDKYCQKDIIKLDRWYANLENLLGHQELEAVEPDIAILFGAIEDMVDVNQGFCYRIKDPRPPFLAEGIRVSKSNRLRLLNAEMCTESLPRLQMIAQSEETLIQAINESIDRNANDAILSRFLSSSRKSLQEFAKANEEQVIAIETYCHFRQINASKSQRLRALFVGMEADLTVPEMLMIYRAED